MVDRTIKIVSFAFIEQSFLKKISSAVQLEFSANVLISEGHIDFSDFFDPARKQYNANKLLKTVEEFHSGEGIKTLGLFNIDLFIPILTYIFGQAYLNGSTGIASAYRLSNARYGMNEDPELFMSRIIKEVIHELGHTYGLIHCREPKCVMGSSTYVEEIDQKEQHICTHCHKLIR